VPLKLMPQAPVLLAQEGLLVRLLRALRHLRGVRNGRAWARREQIAKKPAEAEDF